MSVRVIKLFLPNGRPDEVPRALDEDETVGIWTDRLADETLEVTVPPRPEANEKVLDVFDRRFSGREGYRLLLLPVAASLPHDGKEEKEPDEAEEEEKEQA